MRAGELLFLVVSHLLHLRVFRFEKHLVRAGKILLDLLVLAVLFDDQLELGVLLGDFLEARRVRDELRRRKLVGQLVVTSAELIQFVRKRHCRHGANLKERDGNGTA